MRDTANKQTAMEGGAACLKVPEVKAWGVGGMMRLRVGSLQASILHLV